MEAAEDGEDFFLAFFMLFEHVGLIFPSPPYIGNLYKFPEFILVVDIKLRTYRGRQTTQDGARGSPPMTPSTLI